LSLWYWNENSFNKINDRIVLGAAFLRQLKTKHSTEYSRFKILGADILKTASETLHGTAAFLDMLD
jgi:hypothetical protein|tara:strand:+ start:1120 stop:1317 length:198 start_codon:yes stop_codon:yes gene_type:complete